MSQSRPLFPTLNYDYAAVEQFLKSVPSIDSHYGRRTSTSKGDLIIGLAPVYAELAAFLRALAIHLSLPGVPRFGDPFPIPFLATSPHLAGQFIPPSTLFTQCLDIETGVISDTISAGPCVLFSVDSQGMIVDALPTYADDTKAA